MAEIVEQDLASSAFASRLADLLMDARRRRGLSCRALAKSSAWRFSLADVHAVERGELELTESVIGELSDLYAVDLGSILPDRQGVSVSDGMVSVGGQSASFATNDPAALLTVYLKLVRSLRRQQRAPVVELRREDVERLALYLGETWQQVVDRLAALMGVSRAQRNSMVALFGAGAMVIGLVLSVGSGSAAADAPGGPPGAANRSTISQPWTAADLDAEDLAHAALAGATGSTVVSHVEVAPAAKPVVTAAAPKPVVTTVAPVAVGIAPDGSQVATDLGTGDAVPVPSSTDAPVATAVAPDGSTVAVDLGVGDSSTPGGELPVP